MTREEAKKILERIVNTSNELTHPVILNTEMGAIDMAIEALQAHPTLDDISNAYENGYRQGRFEAQRWILCSERKPRQQQPVIVTDEGDVLTAYINSLNEWMDFHGNRLKGVTAWMSLPSPYKENEA